MKRRYAHFSQVDMKDWRWPSFSPREIASKGEGEILIDTDALDKLQALRNRLGKPLVLTSAYRSPAHNKRVGGAKASLHIQGVAFDVRMENHDPHEFEAAARAVGFTGFGYYPKSGFMHIDTGPARTWGTPWPVTMTSWPVEVQRQPETITEDKQAQAVAGVGVAGALAVAAEHAPLAGTILGGLAPTAQLVAVVVAAALLGYVLWKRSQ
jgi:zinc D-Ala-D-Ala carboxypeptidase